MRVSYQRLRKLLIDKDMKMKDLMEQANKSVLRGASPYNAAITR